MFSIILYMNNTLNNTNLPSYYNKKINELNTQFFLVTKEITNSFPLSKTYPNVNKYVVNYNNDLNNQDKVKSELYVLKNELQKDIQNTENNEKKLMSEINKYEGENKKLKNKIKQLIDKNEGAIGFYNDFNKYYNKEIIKNIIFFIITLSVIIYIIYKNSTNDYIVTPIIITIRKLIENIKNYLTNVINKI